MTKPLPSIRICEATDFGGTNMEARAGRTQQKPTIRMMNDANAKRPSARAGNHNTDAANAGVSSTAV